jgi:hypothetical protein
MASTVRHWRLDHEAHGITTVRLRSWEQFDDFIRIEMLTHTSYLWRGQRCSNWSLESTFDRAMKGTPRKDSTARLQAHLTRFKYSVRGRRGGNPQTLATEDDWWALGQHHGLATPLLDWTVSPFTAAYFAYLDVGSEQTPERAIYALSGVGVREISERMAKSEEPKVRAQAMAFFHPLSDENARLVGQGGLFTRTPLGMDVESWIKAHVSPHDSRLGLIKIFVPDSDRTLALRSLNRMNINHLTMFPDLHGSSLFCNLHLRDEDY